MMMIIIIIIKNSYPQFKSEQSQSLKGFQKKTKMHLKKLIKKKKFKKKACKKKKKT